jgi:hypothetical protein
MLGALRAEPDRSHGNKRASRHLPPDLYRRAAEFVDKILVKDDAVSKPTMADTP